MRKAKPLTLEQVNELADEFFPQFNAIHDRMPEGSSAVDTLAVWDKIAALAGAKKEDQPKNFVGFSNDKVFVFYGSVNDSNDGFGWCFLYDAFCNR